MGFTKRALEEQKFLKEKYPKLWMKYDEYTGNICISEEEFRDNKELRDDVFKIIAEETCFSGKYGRYVMFRSSMSDEKNRSVPCYVVCEANEV